MAIENTTHSHTFPTITKDINLLDAEFAGSEVGNFCNLIEVFGSGVLKLVNPDSSITSYPAASIGHKIVGQYKGILKNGTTATDIVVSW